MRLSLETGRNDVSSSINVKFKSKENSSQLIQEFAAETGDEARSWIVAVNMLGEGVSINRLKYRIHAANIRTPLSFMQDLGRLLRPFPSLENLESVETLIPAHPELIELAKQALNEVAHVVNEPEELEDDSDDEREDSDSENTGGEAGEHPDPPLPPNFIPLEATGEMGVQILDGEEIPPEYANVAEWVVFNDPLFQTWNQTPAHLAQRFMDDPEFFELFYSKYKEAINSESSYSAIEDKEIPLGFPPEYADCSLDKKIKIARVKAHTKAKRLVFLLYPSSKDNKEEFEKNIKKIHNTAKKNNDIPMKKFLGHQAWEIIYQWLSDQVASVEKQQKTEKS